MDDLLKLETETFNKLYTDYRLRFIRFAQTYIPDISIAEDIVMDNFSLLLGTSKRYKER